MSSPEDIPEDREESYPCPFCPEGNIVKIPGGKWGCDSCDWIQEDKIECK